MKKTISIIFLSCLSLCSILTHGAESTKKNHEAVTFGKLPLYFTKNAGQFDSQVKFTANTSSGKIYFTQENVTFLLSITDNEKKDFRVQQYALKLKFIDSNSDLDIIAEGECVGKSNYFIGDDPSNWHTNVDNYSKIRFCEIYEDIDLVYYGNNNRLKYDFIVKPGADPDQILLKYEGATNLSINDEHELSIKIPFGTLKEKKPYAYQIIEGVEIPTKISYRLLANNDLSFSEDTFKFIIGDYDPSYPLFIDPEIVFSSYLGGNAVDWSNDLYVDGAGNIYLTGSTTSSDFPVTSGSIDEIINEGDSLVNNSDVFIAKINNSGNSLDYATYIGGMGKDAGHAISIDDNGNIYITGETSSSDFPVSNNPYQDSRNGGKDCFLSKLNANGDILIFSTYLGGSINSYGNDLLYDEQNNIYIIGHTNSSNFPTTIGAFDRTHNGDYDIFVAKFDQSGTNLLFSTFIGGNNNDSGRNILLDGNGDIYLSGFTFSSNFPITIDAMDDSHNGSRDAFLGILNPDGTDLSYSTYLGGNGEDDARGMDIDSNGNIYIAGTTGSSNFPTTSNAFDEIYNGNIDIFVCKYNPVANNLNYSTFIGGNSIEYAEGIIIDKNDKAIIIGSSESAEFPTTPGAFDEGYNGGRDAIITQLNAGGSDLLYSSFLGGTAYEYGQELQFYGNNSVIIVGNTMSSDFPTTTGAYDESYNGMEDVFITKILFLDSMDCALLIDTVYTKPGDTFNIPIKISDVSGLDIVAAQFQVTFDSLIISVLDVNINESTLPGQEGWTIQHNIEKNNVSLAFAGSTPLNGEGVICNIVSHIPEDSTLNIFTSIEIDSVILNEELQLSSIAPGVISIDIPWGDVSKNNGVQAYDASLILQFLVGSIQLSEYQHLLADVSNNNEITALDASLLLQYIVNLINIFPVESDSPINLFASAEINISDFAAGPGQEVILPFNLAATENLSSIEYTIKFDADVLEILEVDQVSNKNHFEMANIIGSDSLRIWLASGNKFVAEDCLLAVKFKVNEQAASGTSVSISNIRFNENEVIKNYGQINFSLNVSDVEENILSDKLPSEFLLAQNYPNPFNPKTSIRYELPKSSVVNLIIYDILGHKIKTLISSYRNAGKYEIIWDATDIPSGAYFCRMQAGEFTKTLKFILQK